MKDNINVEVIKAGKTSLFCNYIFKAIPLAFDESMSYYECLCGLLNYLKNTIIPVVNNNADAVAELQELFIKLQNFVNNYFDNFDVQDEINKKLDQMVEDGTLEMIIGKYIDNHIERSFINVNDMKNSLLEDGMKAKTLGYYDVNDGGSAEYYITSIQPTSGYYETLTNGNYAILNLNNFNIKQIGAKGNGIDDDTQYFINAINLLKQKFSNENLYGNNSILLIPSGKYKITQKIEIPLYLKIKSLDNVVFYSYIENDSCFEIYSDDNINPSEVFINNYFNINQDISPIIDGSCGGISIINKVNVVKDNNYLTTDAGNSIGIKIGKNTTNLNAYYSLKNIMIADFNIGLLIHTKNNYLTTFENITMFENNYGLQYGLDIDENSGEMIRFINCNISNNHVAINLTKYGSLNLINCSLDYNQLCYLISNPTGCNINVINCHHEGFYSKKYIDDGNLIDLLSKEYYGLVYFNRTTNNFFYQCNVLFNNSSISANKGSANIIRAISNSVNRNCVSFNNVRLSGLSTPNIANWPRFKKDSNSLCNEYVTVLKNNIIPSYNRQCILSKSGYNLINDSFNDNATVGETGNYYSNTVIGNIKILESYGGTTYKIINDTQINNNSIKLHYDNTRENGCTIKLEGNTKINCKLGDIFTVDGLVKNIESGILSKGIRLYDKDNNLLKELLFSDNRTINVNYNELYNFGNEIFYIDDKKVDYIIPIYQVKINKLDNPQYNYFDVLNLQCYKLN